LVAKTNIGCHPHSQGEKRAYIYTRDMVGYGTYLPTSVGSGWRFPFPLQLFMQINSCFPSSVMRPAMHDRCPYAWGVQHECNPKMFRYALPAGEASSMFQLRSMSLCSIIAMSQRLASVRSFPRVSDYFSPTAYTFVTARIPPHSSIHLLHALSLGLLGIYCVAILVSDIHPDLEIRLHREISMDPRILHLLPHIHKENLKLFWCPA